MKIITDYNEMIDKIGEVITCCGIITDKQIIFCIEHKKHHSDCARDLLKLAKPTLTEEELDDALEKRVILIGGRYPFKSFFATLPEANQLSRQQLDTIIKIMEDVKAIKEDPQKKLNEIGLYSNFGLFSCDDNNILNLLSSLNPGAANNRNQEIMIGIPIESLQKNSSKSIIS